MMRHCFWDNPPIWAYVHAPWLCYCNWEGSPLSWWAATLWTSRDSADELTLCAIAAALLMSHTSFVDESTLRGWATSMCMIPCSVDEPPLCQWATIQWEGWPSIDESQLSRWAAKLWLMHKNDHEPPLCWWSTDRWLSRHSVNEQLLFERVAAQLVSRNCVNKECYIVFWFIMPWLCHICFKICLYF